MSKRGFAQKTIPHFPTLTHAQITLDLSHSLGVPWPVLVEAEKNPLNLNQVMLAEESGNGHWLSPLQFQILF